jgi:glycosyltransferase involved in cell wall biosynthesis
MKSLKANPYGAALGAPFPPEHATCTQQLGDLSIVIPNYNGALFLRPLLDQLTPTDAEIIVVDGGSTDGSVALIEKYSDRLNFWSSELDNGQADAINKGLLHATRDFVAYQNSDDLFDLYRLGTALQRAREEALDVVFGPIGRIDAAGTLFDIQDYSRFPRLSAHFSIPFNNQSLLIRREVLERTPIDASYHFCFDLDLASRLVQDKSLRLARFPFPMGALRHHAETKTSKAQDVEAKERRLVAERTGRPGRGRDSKAFRILRFFECIFFGDLWYLTRRLEEDHRSSHEVDGRA